jgi:prepilin-type N-terminal cleavage/methylation domain-containing protein
MRLADCQFKIADCRLQIANCQFKSAICNLQSAISRKAFTLLEVVLAMSLSVVLLGALYLTLTMHYSHARAGREIIDASAIVRTVAARIADDIQGQLSPINPLLYSKVNGTTIMNNPFGGTNAAATSSSSTNSSSSNSSSSNNSSSNNSSQNSASQSNSSPSSSSPSNSGQNNSSQNTQSSTLTPSTVVFNLGVYGDADRLVLTGSWLPKDLTRIQEGQTQTSDLRRVVYWLVKDGKKTGLARQELTNVTGTDAGTLPPDVPDPGQYVIAPEVKKFSLEYFDGTEWQTSWDGTTLDASSNLPIGPPVLIAINITIATPSHQAGGKAKETSFRHVVAIPTANVTTDTTTTAPVSP